MSTAIRAVEQRVPLPNSTCGAAMYAQGFGTWNGQTHAGDRDGIIHAIKNGYRLIDCARVYDNQEALGEGIKHCIDAGIVKREDLYIVSKLWNTDHEPEFVEATTRHTIKQLQCGYLDCLLIHWPIAWKSPITIDQIPEQHGKLFFSPNPNGNGGSEVIDVPLTTTWKAMEKLVLGEERLVRDIGLSNFSIEETQAILDVAAVKPVTNQVEAHPALPQAELKQYSEANGIVLMAFKPLGQGSDEVEVCQPVFTHPEVLKIAKEHGFASGAELCLQWSSQMGFVCLCKSFNPNRVEANAKVPFGGVPEAAMEKLKAFGAAHPFRGCNHSSFRSEPGPFFGNKL